jgi:hypothetical protein
VGEGEVLIHGNLSNGMGGGFNEPPRQPVCEVESSRRRMRRRIDAVRIRAPGKLEPGRA